MTDALIVACIAAVPATLAAISSLVNGRRVSEVHTLVNGLGDKRNAATQKSAFAEGQKETLAAVAAGRESVTNLPENPPAKPSVVDGGNPP